MPVFRGLEVALGSETQCEQLPEFPHPDASSVSLIRPLSIVGGNRLSVAGGTKPDPIISVYVPAIPSIQFWVKYDIRRVPEGITHFCFRLVVNGRIVTTWGVNPLIRSSGTASRALYQPGSLWRAREEAGDEAVCEGIEARGFYFLPPQEKQTPAEDGGLIEVMVMRAKGRQRKTPRLEEFKSQTQYGVSFPSCGLVENPRLASFYEYTLVDPKSSPFATFRFHYRSWTSLHHLNIIPSIELPLSLSPKKAPTFTFPTSQDTPQEISPVKDKSQQSRWYTQSRSREQTSPPNRNNINMSPSPQQTPTRRSMIPVASPITSNSSNNQPISQSHVPHLAPSINVSSSPVPSPGFPIRLRRITQTIGHSRSLSPLKPNQYLHAPHPIDPQAQSPLWRLATSAKSIVRSPLVSLPSSSSGLLFDDSTITTATDDIQIGASARLPLRNSYSQDSLRYSFQSLHSSSPIHGNGGGMGVVRDTGTQRLSMRTSTLRQHLTQSPSPSRIPVLQEAKEMEAGPESELLDSPIGPRRLYSPVKFT